MYLTYPKRVATKPEVNLPSTILLSQEVEPILFHLSVYYLSKLHIRFLVNARTPMALVTSSGKQVPSEHSHIPKILTTSQDFRERLQAIQRGLAQQYRQGTTNVSTSSSEPNSRVTMPQQPESSQLETEPQIEIDIKSEPFDSLHGTTRCFGNYFFP